LEIHFNITSHIRLGIPCGLFQVSLSKHCMHFFCLPYKPHGPRNILYKRIAIYIYIYIYIYKLRMYNFYLCSEHLDMIKVLHLPTDALYISLRKHQNLH
jgi:hypothetical protein